MFSVEQWPLPILGHIAVMMPFDQEFNQIYEGIKTACTDQNMKTLRVDKIYGSTPIINDIFSVISQSSKVICDLTGRNPNVLYETGLAHALDRDVIIIVQNAEDVPFDLRHIRYIEYLPNNEGIEELKKKLSQFIQA